MRAAVGRKRGTALRGSMKDVDEGGRCLGRCQGCQLGDWVVVPFSEREPRGKDAIWGNMDFLWNCIPWGLHDKVTGYGAMTPEFFY